MPGNVQVAPGAAPRDTHDISFSDGFETWGGILEGGPRGIQEVPVQASTLVFGSGGGRYSDAMPGLSHLEQSDWTGGRAQEYFADDNTRYFDGQSLWTLTNDMLLPAPQWKLPQQLNSSYVASGLVNLPGNVKWRSLHFGMNLIYFAAPVTPTANTDVETIYLWLRRRGRPGTLTLEIRTDDTSGGGTKPSSTILKTATVTVSTITDTISQFYSFDFSGTAALTGATKYWIVVYGNASDTLNNHWDIGTADGGGGGQTSADGSTWGGSADGLYFYASPTSASTDKILTLSWKFFRLEGTEYAVQHTPPGIGLSVSSALLRMGDRGECDSNAGNKATVIDATKSWATNVWAGAKVKIVAGPGQGEWRTIASNNGTTLTCDRAFNITQTTSSRYTIYDTPYWMAVTGVPATATVTDVAVIDNLAFFACGTNQIFQMRNNGTGAEQFDETDSNTAWLLWAFYHPDDGVQLWRTHPTTSDISRAVPSTYGGASMTFGSAIPIGEDSTVITGMLSYDDELWVLKEDSLWRVKNDRPSKLDVGLDAAPAITNGVAACTQNLFLYFSWGPSVERLYGGTLDDMGPWQGAGLPIGRTGTVSALLPVFGWLFVAIDGGPSGVSSVMAWNGRGWSEIFRGWEAGRRIQSLHWAPMTGGRPKLLFSFGTLLMYVDFPQDGLHPLRDAGLTFQHEAVCVTSTYDMGSLRLPKFFKEFEAALDNLRRLGSAEVGREVYLDFQIDDQIGTSRWTHMAHAVLAYSPVDTVQLNLGGVRAIRFRLRINTNTATLPVIVRAYIAECFGRTPVKYQYNLRLKVSSLQRNQQGQLDTDPDAFLLWLKQQAGSANKITVHSKFRAWDSKLVIIEPPTVLRSFVNSILGWWGGVFIVTVRDV